MKAVAFIFARGGSKGLPGKNIRIFNGKPLIAWSIQCALAVKNIERVIVSTDSNYIAQIARSYGAETPFIRPAELATDSSPELLSWRHGITFLQESTGNLPEAFVSLPTTSPLRRVEDVERCLAEYGKRQSDVVITFTDAHRSPFFNMVNREENGNLKILLESTSPPSRRQDAPTVFDMTTVCYVADPQFILNHDSIFQGRVRGVHIPKERSVDIDSDLDFKYAEFLQKELHLNG